MAVVINDLVTRFGFQGSEAPLHKYNLTLAGSIKLLTASTAALYASAAAFGVWANGQLKAIDALDALSRRTGVSVQKIQELSFAAEQTQSSAAAVQSTMKSLSAVIGDAAQRGNDTFQRLGISVRDANGQVKSADRILAEVSQRFKALHLTMQEQESFASALGIDPSLLIMMNQTSAQMAALRKEARALGVLNAKQTKQAEEYTASVHAMWFGLNAVKQLVAVGVAPQMENLAAAFTRLLKENKGWIVEGVQATIGVVSALLSALNRLLPVLGLIAAGFVAARAATMGWTAALGLLSRVPIVAAITGVVLVVDDLITAFRGGKSVIADFFQNTFDIDIVKEMTSALHVLNEGARMVFQTLSDIWTTVSRLSSSALGGIMSFFSDQPTDEGATMRRSGVGLPGPNGGGDPRYALPPAAAGRIDNRRVEQRNDIRVYSSDPLAAGRAVDTQLQRQLRNADAQLGAGGR